MSLNMNQESPECGQNKAQSGNDSSEDKSPKKPISYLQEYMAAKQRGDTSKFEIMEKPKSIFGYPVVPNGNVITIRERNEENEIIDVQYVQTQFGLVRFDIVGGERVLVANTPVLTETDTTGLDLSEVFEVPANTGCGTPKEIMLDVKSLITKLQEISTDQSEMRPQHNVGIIDDSHNKDDVWKCSKDKECNILLADADWPPLSKHDCEKSKLTLTRKGSLRNNDFQQAVQETLRSPSIMQLQRTPLGPRQQSQEDIHEDFYIHQSPHFTPNQSEELCSSIDLESVNSQETNYTSFSFISQLSCHSVQELSQIVPTKSPQKQYENVTGQLKPTQEKLRYIQFHTQTIPEKQDQHHNQSSKDKHQIQSKSSPEKRLCHFQAPQEIQQCNAQQSQGTHQLYAMPLQRGYQIHGQQIKEGHRQIQNQPLQENQQFSIQPQQEKLIPWQTETMRFKQHSGLQAHRQECGQVSTKHLSPDQGQVSTPHRSPDQGQAVTPHRSPEQGQVFTLYRSPEQIPSNRDQARSSPHKRNRPTLPKAEAIYQEEKLVPVSAERHPKLIQAKWGENTVIQNPHESQETHEFYTVPETMQRVQQIAGRAQPQGYGQVLSSHRSPEQKPMTMQCEQQSTTTRAQTKEYGQIRSPHHSPEQNPLKIQRVQQSTVRAQSQAYGQVISPHRSPEQNPLTMQRVQQGAMRAQPQEYGQVRSPHRSPEQNPSAMQRVQQGAVRAQPQEYEQVRSPHRSPEQNLSAMQRVQQSAVRAQPQEYEQVRSPHRSPEQNPSAMQRVQQSVVRAQPQEYGQVRSPHRSPEQNPSAMQRVQQSAVRAQPQEYGQVRSPHRSPEQNPSAMQRVQQSAVRAQPQEYGQVRSPHRSPEQNPSAMQRVQQSVVRAQPQEYGQVRSPHRSPEQNPSAMQRVQQSAVRAQPQEYGQVRSPHRSPEQNPSAMQRVQQSAVRAQPQEYGQVRSPHRSPEQNPSSMQRVQQSAVRAQPQEYGQVQSPHRSPEQNPLAVQRVQQSAVRAQPQEYGQVRSPHRSPERKPLNSDQARSSPDKRNALSPHKEEKHVPDEERTNRRQGDKSQATHNQPFQEKHRFQTESCHDPHQFQSLSGQGRHQFQTRPLQDKPQFQSQPIQEGNLFQTHTSKEKDQIQTHQEEIQNQTQPLQEKQPTWYIRAMQYQQQYEALAQRHEYRKLQKDLQSPEQEQEIDINTQTCSQDKRSIQKLQKAEEEERTEKLVFDERGSKQQEPLKEENVQKSTRITPQEVRERLQQQLEEKQKEVQIQQRMQRQNKPRHDGSRRGGPRERLHSPHQGRQPALNTSFIRPPIPQCNDSSSRSRRSSNGSIYKETDKDEAISYVWPCNMEEPRHSLSVHQSHDTRSQARPHVECKTSPCKEENSALPDNQQMCQFPPSHHSQFRMRKSSDPLLKHSNYDPHFQSTDNRNDFFLLQLPQKKTGKGNLVPETNWDSTVCMDDNSDERQRYKTSMDIGSSGPIFSTDPKIMHGVSHNVFDMPLSSSQELSQQYDEDNENIQSVDYGEIPSTTSCLSTAPANPPSYLSQRPLHGEEIGFSVTQLHRKEESVNEPSPHRASSTQLAPTVVGLQGVHKEWSETKTKSFRGNEPGQPTIQQDHAGPSKKSIHLLDFLSIPTCPSCNENFRWPHLLSCFHSFCFRCIISFRSNVEELIKCPLCSWPTTVGDRGPFDLNLDLNLCSRILPSANPFPCTLCGGPGNGVAACMQCMHFLCNGCRSKHALSPLNASHDLEEVIKFKWSQGELAEMCPAHPTSIGDRYCLDCKTMICIICVRYSKQHVQHTFIKEVEHSKKRIQNMTVDVDRMRDHVRRQMQPMILKKQDIESKARACKRNIHLFSNEVIEVANKKRSESRALLDKVHENIISGIKRLEDLTTQFSNEYRTLAEFTERYLKNPTPAFVLPLASKIRRRYEDMLQKYQEIKELEGYLKVDLLFSPEFPAVNDTITQSYHFETFESLSDIFEKNTDMSFMLRQNMDAILDKNSSDINSQIKDEFADRENRGSVSSDVPANVVEGNEPEQDFSRQGTLSIHSFGEKGNGDYSFGEPSGVVYLSNGSLAVCDTSNHRIVVYDENYVYERTIGQPPMKLPQEDYSKPDRFHKSPGCLYFPYRLAQCPQSENIVVIERPPSRAIQIFDFDGKFLHRFGNDILQHPRGVAVDENGVIVIVEGKTMKLMLFTQDGKIMQIFHLCVYLEFPNDIAAKDGMIYISDNRGHCVHIFDYNGQPRGSIGNESVTYYPIGVSLNFMNNIVVTDNHNTFNISVFNRDGNYQYGYKSRVKHANCYNVAVHPSRCELAVTSRDYLVIIFDYSSSDPKCT